MQYALAVDENGTFQVLEQNVLTIVKTDPSTRKNETHIYEHLKILLILEKHTSRFGHRLNFLSYLLEEVPLHMRARMWFQLGYVPLHILVETSGYI